MKQNVFHEYYLLYVFSFLSIISLQLATPLPEISQYVLSQNMEQNKFNKIVELFYNVQIPNYIRIKL